MPGNRHQGWLIIIIIFFNLFIFGYIGSSLLRVGSLWLQGAGATLRCSVWASHCGGFSCGAGALGAQASVVAARRLSSCGMQVLEHTGSRARRLQ